MAKRKETPAPVCPYCGAEARLQDSKRVYGRSYGPMWICRNYPRCDSYVGVHRGTDRPLGRMADAELRRWKKKAHAAFDPHWKRYSMTRSEMYRWLAERMGLPRDECHIGMFDVAQCKRVVELFGEGNV